MDSSLECPVCLNIFSSTCRPKSLNCGHSICVNCLDDIMSKKSILCPLCMEPIKNPESLPVNWLILERVSFLEVKCFKHNETIATYFNSKLILALCSQCKIDYNPNDLLDIGSIDLSNFIIQKAIDTEIAYSTKINPQLRAKIRQIPMKSNSVKIQLLKELVDYVECIKCEEHSLNAISLNLRTGKLLCSECKNIGEELLLSDPRTNNIIEAKVYELVNNIDYYYINPHYREQIKLFSNNSLDDNVLLLKNLLQIRSIHIEKLISSVCILCNQEFAYPSNLPCKLPCKGTHLICEICSKQVSYCPLDHNSFQQISLQKISPNLCLCAICEEACDSIKIPILLTCGIIACNSCAFTVKCKFCSLDHSTLKNEPQNFSKFFLQVIENCRIACVTDGKTAIGFSITEMNGYCHRCSQSKPVEKIEDIDLSAILIREAYKKAHELGQKVTPTLSKQLSEMKSLTNIQKLELYKFLVAISSPLPSSMAQTIAGLQIPAIKTRNHYLQRFNSLLPNPLIPSSGKPWYIDKKKQQVEAICFKASRALNLLGVTICCPIKEKQGLIEYLDIIEGDSLGGKRLARQLERQTISGIVADLQFDRPLHIIELEFYVIVFKIDADFLYKGNPLDKNELKGTDGTEFHIFETKQKGFFTNGQGHISGPLIRLIYQ